MLLQFHGVNIPLPRFIPLSTFTFGFQYSNDGKIIVAAPLGCPCQSCMAFITEQLGYSYEIIVGEELSDLWSKAKQYIDSDRPIVAGPLPMELYQQYNPQAPLTGYDSFCVVCGYDEENNTVFITDTFGLGYMPISMDSLESGWRKGKRLCPKALIPQVPFLFVVKEKLRAYDELEVARNALKRACNLMKGQELSDSLSLGIIGEKKFARDLENQFHISDTNKLAIVIGLLRDLLFLIGSQAKGDIAYLLRDFAAKASSQGERSQTLSLAELYEAEQTIYMDALKTSSLTSKAIEAGSEFAPYFETLHKQMKEIVNLEEKALDILQGL